MGDFSSAYCVFPHLEMDYKYERVLHCNTFQPAIKPAVFSIRVHKPDKHNGPAKMSEQVRVLVVMLVTQVSTLRPAWCKLSSDFHTN